MGLPSITVPEYKLILPSTGKEIKYRPFLVKEEKLLLIAMESEEAQQIMDATKKVIQNCVFGDFDVDDLPIFDIEYIFLWLRGRAKGEVIDLKYNCPQCKNIIEISLEIEKIEIKKSDNHNNKIELTDSLGIVLNYPTINIQQKLDSLGEDVHAIDKIFKAVLYCTDYIYDNEEMYSCKDYTEEELTTFLESLSDTQFQKISVFFETMPKLSHSTQLVCKNKTGKKVCNYKEDLKLEGLASFFE